MINFDTKRRVLVLFVIFILSVVVIFLAYGYYNIFAREQLNEEAKRYTIINKNIQAQRGSIYSHDGNLMSTTLPLYKLSMDTRTEYLAGCKSDSVINIYIDSLSCLENLKTEHPQDIKSI